MDRPPAIIAPAHMGAGVALWILSQADEDVSVEDIVSDWNREAERERAEMVQAAVSDAMRDRSSGFYRYGLAWAA